jgi:hypothetical protein
LESRPLSRPSPSANLVGVWKGDPLDREVRGSLVTQIEPARVLRQPDETMSMLDVVYAGLVILFFAAFVLYARGCEKL